MKKLTPTQLIQISYLGENPLFDFADIAFHKSGFTHIHVSTVPGADWRDVAMALSEIFPDITFDRKQTGDDEPTYNIEVGEGICFFLNMVAVETEWTAEKLKTAIIGVDLAKSEDMTGNVWKPWTLEEILRNEG